MKLKDLLWIAYPVLVVVSIFVSLQLLLGTGQTSLVYLSGRQQSIKQDQTKSEKLRAKIDALNAVDQTLVNTQLQEMLKAVPAVRQAPLVLAGIRSAAQSAGITVDSYSSPNVGDVKEASQSGVTTGLVEVPFRIDVTVEVSSLDQLNQFMRTLESQIPILRVANIKWATGKAVVSVVPAYTPWAKVNLGSEAPLPSFADNVVRAQQMLGGYTEISVAPYIASSSGGSTSPF